MASSSESLLQRIQSGGFLPLSLTIDPLQQILLEIMGLIKDQSQELQDLKSQLDSKADKDVFDGFQKMIDDKEKAAIEREKALENMIGDKERELLDKLKDTNERLDHTNENVDKNRETCDKLNNDVNDLRERLSALETNSKPSDSDNADNASLQDLRDEIAKLKESMKEFDQNKDALKDIDQLRDALKDLDQLRDALKDLDRLRDALKDLDQLRDALKDIDQLRDALKDIGQLKDALKDIEDLKDAMKNINDIDKLRDAMKDLEELHKLRDAMKDVEDLAKLKDALRRLDELAQRVNDIGQDLRNLNNEAVRRTDEEKIVVRPPPERDETNPRTRTVELGEDDSKGERRGSGEGQSHRKMPLPDLIPEDINEALRQLREELTRLQARVGDNEDKMNAKHNELDDQIKALWSAIEDLKGQLAGIPAALDEIKRDLAGRPDKAMIERLFEKFKAAMNGLAESMGRKGDDSDKRVYATMDDIKRLETNINQMNMEWEEAAAARKSTCCLSCGRPYRTVTGAITDEATMAVLGAAPISHLTTGEQNKPCFVYGSDNELYYSSSPRGKTFVASPRTPGTARR